MLTGRFSDVLAVPPIFASFVTTRSFDFFFLRAGLSHLQYRATVPNVTLLLTCGLYLVRGRFTLCGMD